CERSDDRRTIPHDQHTVEGPEARRADDRVHCGGFVIEADGNRAVLPRVIEVVAPIGREDELDAKMPRRVAECARLVSGGGGEEKNAAVGVHTRATCSELGSAQQYQGSFRYGTVARSRAGFESPILTRSRRVAAASRRYDSVSRRMSSNS